MTRSSRLTLVAAGLVLCGVVAIAAPANPVGLLSARYEDTTRRNWTDTAARPLQTLIWYPAASGTVESDWEVAIYKAGHVAKNAPLADQPRKLPLIVLSHGTGGAAVGLSWLAQALAAQGYLVAAPNHHGNTAAEDKPVLEGTIVWWDRPRDLSRLIDSLLIDPQWGPRIDASRIGVAGFSIGGYTALAAVGARLSQTQFMKSCDDVPHSCDLPPEVHEKYSPADVNRVLHEPRVLEQYAHMGDDYRDARIRAAFVIAPVLASAMTAASLAAIHVPAHIVVGTADDQAAPGRNAEPIAASIPRATLNLLPGVTHYSFLTTCTARGVQYAKELCSSPPGVDRDELHGKVASDAVAFFNQVLSVQP
jgi:predicted dienelactone hydrolase